MSAQVKGPAEVAASPSHGSNNPQEGSAVNRQHDTTASRDGATDLRILRSECAVVELCERLALERAAFRRLDEIRPENVEDRKALRIREKEDHFLSCEDAVKDLIACSKAGCLEGAAIQLFEIVPRIEALFDSLGSNAGTADRDDYRATMRLLYSALDAIERRLSVPVAVLVDQSFGDRQLNPWLSLEERDALHREMMA